MPGRPSTFSLFVPLYLKGDDRGIIIIKNPIAG
jgi:hypothetical protein